jgi:phosphomevalonate kinase
MGEHALTPIEPDEITDILNVTQDTPGVLIAGAPGAGGYDAIFAVVLDDACLPRVETTWLGWEKLFVI